MIYDDMKVAFLKQVCAYDTCESTANAQDAVSTALRQVSRAYFALQNFLENNFADNCFTEA